MKPLRDNENNLRCIDITCLNNNFINENFGYCQLENPRVKEFENDSWGCLDGKHSLANNKRIAELLYKSKNYSP